MLELVNDKASKGELAAEKKFFPPDSRYAIAPVHSNFEDIAWFVWDAARARNEAMELTCPVFGVARTGVIAIKRSQDEAMVFMAKYHKEKGSL